MKTLSNHSKLAPIYIFMWLFFLVVAIQLFVRLMAEPIPWLAMMSKSLLMPFLFGYYWTGRPSREKTYHLMVGLALLFSFSGDVWLMFEGKLSFLLGLSSFLITHLIYIFIFVKMTPKAQGLTFLRRNPWWVLPFVWYAYALVREIYPGLEGLSVPVIVYALIICLMVLQAVDRKGRVGQKSFLLVLIGAILFMVSDSLIALGKFYEGMKDVFLLPFWIMLTYSLGQFMIVRGLMEK